MNAGPDRRVREPRQGRLHAEGRARGRAPLQRGALVGELLLAVKALEAEALAAFPDAQRLTVGEILRWPGVVRGPSRMSRRSAGRRGLRCLGAALAAFGGARRREGERIAELLEKRAAGIIASLDAARPLLDGGSIRYRDELRERLERLDVQADPERLEQELALFAQRIDVAEELDRLDGHVAEMRAHARAGAAVGRRLDFLMQELNREANTLGSKSVGRRALAGRARAQGADRADARAGAEPRMIIATVLRCLRRASLTRSFARSCRAHGISTVRR